MSRAATVKVREGDYGDSVEIGEMEVFAPAVPCLVVHTWYLYGEPESTVTYFWQDPGTGLINHEVVFAQAVGFDTALAWAQQHAPTRGVERIHVKHAPPKKAHSRRASKGTPKKRTVRVKTRRRNLR